jgi:hypothetical protein
VVEKFIFAAAATGSDWPSATAVVNTGAVETAVATWLRKAVAAHVKLSEELAVAGLEIAPAAEKDSSGVAALTWSRWPRLAFVEKVTAAEAKAQSETLPIVLKVRSGVCAEIGLPKTAVEADWKLSICAVADATVATEPAAVNCRLLMP